MKSETKGSSVTVVNLRGGGGRVGDGAVGAVQASKDRRRITAIGAWLMEQGV